MNIKLNNQDKIKKRVWNFVCIVILGLVIIPINSLAVMQSANYKIKYETISGGEGPEQSPTYKLFESIGEVGEGEQRSITYKIGGGQAFGIMANFPSAPALVNDGAPPYFDRLHFTINNGNNPSDTLFAIAISSDNWVTTRYIQNDNTVGNVLGPEDWQTYINWGGAVGELVTSLTVNTTYKIKVEARQGDFTMTGWGPESAQAITGAMTLTFQILGGNTNGTQPNQIDFGTLVRNSYRKLLGAKSAYAGILVNANPTNNEIVTVRNQVYTFKSDPVEAATQTFFVFIGATRQATAVNLYRAIDNTDGANVGASNDPGDQAQVWVIAIIAGTTGNNYAIVDGTGGDLVLTQDAGTFIDGQDGSNYQDMNLGFGETDEININNGAWGTHLRIATNSNTGYIITVQDIGFSFGANIIGPWAAQYGFGLWAIAISPSYGETDPAANEIVADAFDVDLGGVPGALGLIPATLASFNAPAIGDNISIEYNLRINAIQPGGQYSDTLTYTATANF